mmetsp:Transcript_12981/g.20812  ORF Transcript_12981/g.20812 Transcript_12981/m.20812 type:complete len:446 (-) Transcript_12981:138-1475(-)
MMMLALLSCVLSLVKVEASTYIFNGTAGAQSSGISNTALLNSAFARMLPGDTLVVPNKTFWLAGGVRASNVINLTIVLDGTLSFLPGRKGWPTQDCAMGGNPLQPKKNGTCVQEAFFIANATGLTLTSTGTGKLYGSGNAWWGYIKYLIHGEDRPRLLSIVNATDVLVEHWLFEQSPYWTFTAFDVAGLEISHCSIDNRVNQDDAHDVWNLDALNTDGFDVAGRDIHIHDCSVWNQDDCFTIQPMDSRGLNAKCTENVLVENVNASGLGLTVGAIHPSPGHNCVRNITFRHARMHHTFKGIYVKSGNSTDLSASAEITNILFEDIEMDTPEQVPIWIGPAQESDSKGACSLLWPSLSNHCPAPPTTVSFTNITLRRVKVQNAKHSPGVILGNPQRPMKGIVFDDVAFTPIDPSKKPWGSDFYHCEGVEGAATDATSPKPPCFKST